jgi:hypothetical protein
MKMIAHVVVHSRTEAIVMIAHLDVLKNAKVAAAADHLVVNIATRQEVLQETKVTSESVVKMVMHLCQDVLKRAKVLSENHVMAMHQDVSQKAMRLSENHVKMVMHLDVSQKAMRLSENHATAVMLQDVSQRAMHLSESHVKMVMHPDVLQKATRLSESVVKMAMRQQDV